MLLTNRVDETAIRVPTVLGAIVPEMGAVFHRDGTSGAYVMWCLPFTLLLASNLALDLRPRVLFTLYSNDVARDTDVFLGVSVGLTGAQIGAELPGSSWNGGLFVP